MLILTLTITAFTSEDDPGSSAQFAGDYSAVFPLLVVSVFISLMASRDIVFYSTQRSRGDIIAVPEVLCQPGKAGAPVVIRYTSSDDDYSSSDESISTPDSYDSDLELAQSNGKQPISDIFAARDNELPFVNMLHSSESKKKENNVTSPKSEAHRNDQRKRELFDLMNEAHGRQLSSSRLDELLGIPIASTKNMQSTTNTSDINSHRRSQSLPFDSPPPEKFSYQTSATIRPAKVNSRSGSRERSNSKGSLVRVPSFGSLDDHQPSLLDQARLRSASSAPDSSHRRVPSLPSASGQSYSNNSRHRRFPSTASSTGGNAVDINRKHNRIPSIGMHSRKNSESSGKHHANHNMPTMIDTGALSIEDIEQSFNEVLTYNKPPTPSRLGH